MIRALTVAALLVVAAGCGSPTATSLPPTSPRAVVPTGVVTTPAASISASSVPSAVPTPGFVFDPESIVGYYQSIGYTCAARQPSSTAAGHEFESCQLVDADSRTRTLGIVTDPADNVVDAFFSVRGAGAETVRDTAAVLDPFAAFLGAFLGTDEGTAQLPWLAAHLGDADARVNVGELTIATYTPAPDDHTKVTVEIATRAYLDAPEPSTTPGP